MTDLEKVKSDYRKYLDSGECPCCFPYWGYGIDFSVQHIWDWQDEMDAWDVYERLNPDD